MRRLLVLAAALAVAGCSGGEREQPPPPASEAVLPAWLDGTYTDRAIEFRFPGWWRRSTSDHWGELISDHRSRHPAFVSVQYLDEPLPATREGFGRLAGTTLRPPEGRGLTLRYAQTAYVDGIRGFEAAFVWQVLSSAPVGPTMRTFGVELRPGTTLFLVLAAERPALHAGAFGWIRKTLRVRPPTGRAGGAVLPPRGPRSVGGYVNH